MRLQLVRLFLVFWVLCFDVRAAFGEDFCRALQKEVTAKLLEKISSGVSVVIVSSFFDKTDIKTCEEEIRIKFNLWHERFDIRTSQKNFSLPKDEIVQGFCSAIGCADSVLRARKFRLFYNPTTRERLIKLQQQLGIRKGGVFSLSPDLPGYYETLKSALIEIDIQN
jgi:hypothetical protein